MKIQKIEINNLSSIEGSYTIDFTDEPLRSAGLFAITGDTGSGKSTLLDAICLALYNKAPRFDNIERVKRLDGSELKRNELQNYDTRNMLRRGCREGSCGVVFSIGNETYYARWSVRLKRTDSYDNVVRSLEQLKPNHKTFDTSQIDEKIQAIIGLDYLQFTRTVVLAQNSFANFLKARQNDKSALLEKLTGTEIYGHISQSVFRLCQQAEQTLMGENRMVEGLRVNLLDEEDLKRLNDSCNLDRSSLKLTEEHLEATNQKLAWYAAYEQTAIQLNEAEIEQQKCQKKAASTANEEQLINRHDEVVCIQPLFQEIKVMEQDLESSKAQMSALDQRLVEQKTNVTKIANDLELQRNKYNESALQIKQMQPKLNRGHALQGEITETHKELQEKITNLNLAEVALQDKRKIILQKSVELTNARRKIEAYKTSLQALTPQKQMLERVELICEKLNRLNDLTKEKNSLRKRIDERNKKKNEYQQALDFAKKEENRLAAQLSTSKNEIFVHVQSNNGLNGQDLQRRTNNLYDTQRELKSALELWLRLSQTYQLIETKTDEIRQHRVRIEQEQKSIDQLTKSIDILSASCEHMNTAFTLCQSQDITSLRQRLQEGTACPVCGATHHPYHTETERELGKLLQSLEKEYKETSSDLKQKQLMLSDLQRSHATGVGRLKAEEEFLIHTQQELAIDIDNWKQYTTLDRSFNDASATVNRNARRLTIEQLLENTDRAASEAQKMLDAFNFHQTYINSLNDKIGLIEKYRAEEQSKTNELVTEMRITTSAIEELNKEITKNEHQNTDLYEELDRIITLTSWFTRWGEGHDSFCIQLMKMAQEWKSKSENLLDEEQTEYRINEELKAMQTLLDEYELKRRLIADDLYKAKELLKEKQQEIVSLFNGKTVEEVAEKLHAENDSARQNLENGKQLYDNVSSVLQTLNGQQQSLIELKQKRETSLCDKRSELDLWIRAFNHTHNPVQIAELEKLFKGDYNWNALRQLVLENKEQLLRINDKLELTRKKMLALQADKYRPSNLDEETTSSLLSDKEITISRLNEIREKLSASNSRLQSHERCTKQLEELSEKMEQLKKDQENWERLNQLIGSADGKKFREQAQSYTFRFLVEYANAHLEQLSTRYRLRNAPNTLSLEIIDRDMFDEIRSVNSLSGGETFIVSLGLALGLSSLSSNNLNIGSLFIDEGFGNLDSDSLELVMTALSNLQSEQGRKVGVISHTEQIRSRIHPQIRLIKYPTGGKSRIEIN
ncbi:MAG: AAA family ATPase [Bacteroidaceae bacterium]